MRALTVALAWALGFCATVLSSTARSEAAGCLAEVEIDTPVESSAYLVIASGRLVHSCAASTRCSFSFPRVGRAQSLHVYELTAAGQHTGSVPSLGLVQSVDVPASEEPGLSCLNHASKAVGAASPLNVGILYEGWHAYAVTALNNVSRAGGAVLSVEDVIRSNGNLTLNDILDKWGQSDVAQGFYYQEMPRGGAYCIYRARPGEVGVLPDCAGINATLARHAAELTAAGITFVTVDGTNLGSFSPFADALQLRPGEVVFEEWAALRARGLPTPAIAAWQRAIAGSDLWQRWLDVYNDAAYRDLVLRDPAGTGKLVMFVPAGADAGVVAQIENNGGRSDVVTQPMWAINGKEAEGQWSFFSPCEAAAGGGYTTSVVGLQRGATGCGQLASTGGPLGSQLAVSPSYQLGYGSVPFEAANKYDGLTFKRQFGTLWDGAAATWRQRAAGAAAPNASAAAAAAYSALPGTIYVSSYNEWIAQPQANPFGGLPLSFSMGLPRDPNGGELWVDSYGASTSRDIEDAEPRGPSSPPSLVALMASCLRVAGLVAALDAATSAGAGGDAAPAPLPPALLRDQWGAATQSQQLAAMLSLFGPPPPESVRSGLRALSSCAVAGEACCAYNETTDGFTPVWSLRLLPAAAAGAALSDDRLATTDAAEVSRLTAPGGGWAEVCNAYSGPTDFCVDGALTKSTAAWRGPFVLHAGGCSPQLQLPNRSALYRCVAATEAHFISSDPTCEGATVESLLGCTHGVRTSNMARALVRCRVGAAGDPAAVRYHSLDGPCDAGDTQEGMFGYAR